MISRNVSRSKPDLEAQLTSRDQLLPSRLNLPTMRNRNRYIRKITMNNAVKIGFAIVFSIICTDKYSEVLPTGHILRCFSSVIYPIKRQYQIIVGNYLPEMNVEVSADR